ncbi:response regulator [Undibacterium sp.]|uniref:response regulator n=1 Tax=Undibacterium sp. TaxID=1914977 RepID=UPI0037521C84
MKKLQLLYVDDSFQDAILFRSLLKKASQELGVELNCDVTKSGIEALQMIFSSNYDLVFLDQQMPDPDGLQTFESVRQKSLAENLPVPPIISYSNCDLREFRERCLKAGMSEFVVKYLPVSSLVTIVRKYCAVPENVV